MNGLPELERLRQRMKKPGTTLPANFQDALHLAQNRQTVGPDNAGVLRSESWEAVTRLLAILSQTFRFSNDPKREAPAYHAVLDKLEPWQIQQAGRLALEQHRYPTMPMPADLYFWACQETEEAQSRKWTTKGARLTEKDFVFTTDENGHEVVTIRRRE